MEKIVHFDFTCFFFFRGEERTDGGDETFECFFEGGEGESSEVALACVGAFVAAAGVRHDGIWYAGEVSIGSGGGGMKNEDEKWIFDAPPSY